ncbi:lipopolysaccharide-induced tumor necrosis factor-alpha factor homolog [Spodoptera litura]|uniref:Lipopolysaccharide-induced tumor necrosis factor-alpha factor homolog n=1 Tax=Spodoptera litura TaxID=69820 RepID=A0A9J7DXH0_SPOLT|nr:lipopolysaccharide-induced tumor necrosis factor-alpha factor homolog [Spodoptera litura]
MDMNSGVNPAQSDTVREQLYLNSEEEKAVYHREPPPSYDATFNSANTVPEPVTNQPTSRTVIIHAPLKDSPMVYNCPKCDERIVTAVTHINTQRTHMLAGFLCGVFCWCCLCCVAAVPYLTKVFKETQHHCPNCKSFLGSYSKL